MTPATTTSPWRRIGRWLPGVLISLVAIIALAQFAKDGADVRTAFAQIKPMYLVLVVLGTLGFLFVRAQAWRVLLGGKPTILQTFFAINEGYLLNNVLPFRAGEFARAIFLGKATGLGTVHIFSTIVLERIFDVAFAAGLLLATVPLALAMESARQVAVIALLFVVIGLVLMFLSYRYRVKIEAWLEKFASRWDFARHLLLPQFSRLLQGFEVLNRPAQFLGALFWIALSWLIAVFNYWVYLLSFAPEAPFWWGAFADSALGLSIAIPSAPAALGVFEAALVGALTILGLSEGPALAYAISLHAVQFVTTGILGLWGLLRERQSIQEVLNNMERKPSPQQDA
ncbi:MAG TPA: lysylphosphatidylglycerol synthase transmembrane domain-containing protein [Anaerolineaceae bacterium]|jgi:uncharacterized protein (TIRG00374 family)|nr:lysylphosphatidylglycerol synthase transmembrane domain-containing protein [Anaerolineaceae bacterium]